LWVASGYGSAVATDEPRKQMLLRRVSRAQMSVNGRGAGSNTIATMPILHLRRGLDES
jgi:hypothetical protein